MQDNYVKGVKRYLKNKSMNLKISTIIMLLLGSTSYGTTIDEDNSGIKLEATEGKYYYVIGDEKKEINDNVLEINGNIVTESDYGFSGLEIGEINNPLDIYINGNILIKDNKNRNNAIKNNGEIGKIIINGNINTNTNSIISNDGKIKLIENNGKIFGKEDWTIYNGFNASVDRIINNGIINLKIDESKSGGVIVLNKNEIGNIENNSMIKLETNSTQKKITNANIIESSEKKIIGNIKNNGIVSSKIIAEGPEGYSININGIFSKGNIESIENNGIIEGIVMIPNNSLYRGIYLDDGSSTNELKNRGIIYSSSNREEAGTKTFGISIYWGKLNTFINTGSVYGKYIAYYEYYGDITTSINYGLFIEELEESSNILTKGLEIKVNEGNDYTLVSGEFGKEYSGENIEGIEYDIKNAQAKKDGDKIVGTESIAVNGEIKNSIYNGITDTVKISGDIKFDNVTVNGYKSAVIFGEEGGNLTLNNSIINGGIDREYDDEGNLLSSSPTIKGSEKSDTLTMVGDTKINGKIDLGNGEDTINFGEKLVQETYSDKIKDNINVLDDISGVENININENTTFFETSNIDGVKNIEIGEGKELGLRLKVDGENITHSLTGNDGLKITGKGSEDSTGKINLISSEIGEDSVIDMSGIDVTNVAFGTSSILDKVEVELDGDIKIEIGKDLGDVIVKPEEPEKPDPDPDPNPDPDPDEKLPENINYESLNKIYGSIVENPENVTELKKLIGSDLKTLSTEQEKYLVNYLAEMYVSSPYSLSSELSRKSVDNFVDIVSDKDLKPKEKSWSIYGGFTHIDGGVENSYYGQNQYTWDNGIKKDKIDSKLSGLYTFGEYGVKDNLSFGVIFGANNLESEVANGSKVDGTAIYLGGFVKKYMGNLRLLAGAGYQYGDYEVDRYSLGADKIRDYGESYNDNTFNLYTDIKYSHMVRENFYLEPSIRLNYIHISQEGIKESGKLSIETDSKDFDYTNLRFGMDIRKNFYTANMKHSLVFGGYYEKMLDGDENEKITARFEEGSDFDILVAGKNRDKVGVRVKYEVELENGISFDVKGDYSFARDVHIGDMKHEDKGEWRVGVGLGYRF